MEPSLANTKVLLVDDDPLVLKIYQEGLARKGLNVETASDGLSAVKMLRGSRPDVVVLDLMMPRFSGLEVLKFIRSETGLAGLPVVTLSNSHMNEMANEAIGLGVQAAQLKIRCTPSELAGIIAELMAEKAMERAPASEPLEPRPESVERAPVPGSAPHSQTSTPTKVAATEAEFMAKSREDFLANATAIIAALRTLERDLSRSATPLERSQRVELFYRKVHFLSAMAGLAECHLIARMASAFEALLFELMEKPGCFGPSVLRTIAGTVDFFGVLFERARVSTTAAVPHSFQGLVVDDDPISNRLIVGALRHAEIQARSTENPQTALQWLEQSHYDLVLLDIEMPGMDGFEVCKRLRMLPGYGGTPVIFVTGHAHFDHRAKSVLSGGDDLISKPVFPIELAVKAVTHILKTFLAESPSTAKV